LQIIKPANRNSLRHQFAVFNCSTSKRERVFRSTKTASKRQAQRIANAWEKAALATRNAPKLGVTARRPRKGTLSAQDEQCVIQRGIAEINRAAGLE
jgi:hypothetical protein